MNQTTAEQGMDLNEKILEQVIIIASKVSVEAATKQVIQEYEKQKLKVQQRDYNKRLYNAKILLKNYAGLKKYVEAIDNKAKASVPKMMINEKENLINLLEFGDDIVSSIKESSQKTIVMIKHLDNALIALELIYKQEDNEMHFNILKRRYVQGMTAGALAEMYNMNKRSIYKIIDSTSERLAILLFGIYGIKLE